MSGGNYPPLGGNVQLGHCGLISSSKCVGVSSVSFPPSKEPLHTWFLHISCRICTANKTNENPFFVRFLNEKRFYPYRFSFLKRNFVFQKRSKNERNTVFKNGFAKRKTVNAAALAPTMLRDEALLGLPINFLNASNEKVRVALTNILLVHKLEIT